MKTIKAKWNEYTLQRSVAAYFNYRNNMIIPNIYYPNMYHECDVLVVSKAGYMTEVEIKITLEDFKRDIKKKYKSDGLKYFYYAVPSTLVEQVTPLLPTHAGLLSVRPGYFDPYFTEVVIKSPANKECIVLTDEQRINLGRLCAIKLWNIKENRFNKMMKSVKMVESESQCKGDDCEQKD